MSVPEWCPIASVEAEWDALADRIDAEPWLRPGWFQAWTDAFSQRPVTCLVLRGREGLRGLIPVVRYRSTLVSPTNWHSPGYSVIAEDDATQRALLQALIADVRNRLSLRFLPDDAAAVLRDCAVGHRATTRIILNSPYVEIGRETLSKNTRKHLRKAHRRLSERGRVTFEVVTASDEVARVLDEGFAVEAAGWKGRNGTAIRSRPDTRRFYEQVARWAAQRGLLRLFFLRVAGRAVAFAFVLQDGHRLYDLKTGFDEAFAEASPGILITREMLSYGAQEGLSTFEFLGATADWKLRFATGARALHEVQIFGRGPVAGGHWLAQAYARPCVRYVRTHARPLIGRINGRSVPSAGLRSGRKG